MVRLISPAVLRPISNPHLSLTTRLGRPLPATPRCHATQHGLGSEARRRSITPLNDDGNVPWSELSAGEKTARAAQQTVNLGLVVVGVVLTGGVGYFLYQEVFSTDSKVSYFNRALNRIKKDHRCLELLGDSKKITAYGEETNNKWRRARPIASSTRKDPQGNDHLLINFNVEGPKGKGRASIHLVKSARSSEYEYRYFFVDVAGHQRIYLENSEAQADKGREKQRFKLFGVNWG